MTENQQRQTYNLFTAISMIVGVVIGSGIYFKADDILTFAGGNIGLALVSLVVASSSIVFGGLTLSELARRTTTSGGIANYMATFVKPAVGASFGFFQSFVYLPSLLAVVCWVAGIYTGQVLGIDFSLEVQIGLGFFYLTLLALANIFSRQLGGWFQSLSTAVKVIPLIMIALIGLFWTGQAPSLPAEYTPVPVRDVGWGWLSALVPLAFAYDGWTVVASIAAEVKKPEKNVPRALFIAPSIILVLYMLYIYGMAAVLGESFVMSVGNDAAKHFLTLVLNDRLVPIFMIIIVISVLGVANGIFLGCMRLPQAFAERRWLPSQRLATIHPKYQVSLSSGFLIYGLTAAWLGLHYLITKNGLLPNSDVSEISIVFNAASLSILYVTVIKMYRQGKVTNRLTGLIAPVLALLGTAMLLVGSFLNNFWLVSVFMLICILSCGLGYAFYRKGQA